MLTLFGSVIVIAIGVFLILLGITDIMKALKKHEKPETVHEVVEDNSEIGSVSK